MRLDRAYIAYVNCRTFTECVGHQNMQFSLFPYCNDCCRRWKRNARAHLENIAPNLPLQPSTPVTAALRRRPKAFLTRRGPAFSSGAESVFKYGLVSHINLLTPYHPYKVFDDVYFFFFGADFIFRGKVKKLLCPATVYYTYSYRLIDTLMYVTIKKNLVNKLSSYQLNSVHYILIIILQNPHFLIFGFNTYKTTKCPPPPKVWSAQTLTSWTPHSAPRTSAYSSFSRTTRRERHDDDRFVTLSDRPIAKRATLLRCIYVKSYGILSEII